MDIKADVVFVTELEVSGFLNGVVNMAFSTAQFVPDLVRRAEDDDWRPAVMPAPVITANLRFDLRLAQIIHDRLGEIIEAQTKPQPKVTN